MTIDRRAFLVAAMSGSFAFPFARRAFAATEVERVDALIARMTVEEKAGQMTCLTDSFRHNAVRANAALMCAGFVLIGYQLTGYYTQGT